MNLFSNLDWKPPIEKDTSRLPDLVCQRCFRLLGIHESLETLNFKEEGMQGDALRLRYISLTTIRFGACVV